MLNLVRPQSTSVIVDRDGLQRRLRPLEDAEVLARQLLAFYWKGLHEDLHLFPQSSMEFAAYSLGLKKLRSGKALDRARSKWVGNPRQHIPGEGDDPYLRLLYGGEPPFDESFEQTSLSFWQPLFESLEGKVP